MVLELLLDAAGRRDPRPRHNARVGRCRLTAAVVAPVMGPAAARVRHRVCLYSWVGWLVFFLSVDRQARLPSGKRVLAVWRKPLLRYSDVPLSSPYFCSCNFYVAHPRDCMVEKCTVYSVGSFA